MIRSLVGSPQVHILEKSISASSLRHKVISNNIANVNTPGFKRSQVAFEDILQQKLSGHNALPMAQTHSKHINYRPQDLSPRINLMANSTLRVDGNNVDIDAEMATMAKNSIYYDALSQQMSRYFSGIKSAINEGRR